MNLHTDIPIIPQEPTIGYHSDVLLLGSCFSENIGARFEYFKFKTLINPFGILFHPKAIENFLWMVSQQEEYTEDDLFFHNEQWHCFDAHSRLSAENKMQVVTDLNSALDQTYTTLKKVTHVVITLGTSWVYRLKAMDMIVANCHKVAASEFHKELLSIEAIQQCIENSIALIRSVNPKTTIVFTVSPVRHIKDGMVENTRSKSHLLTALHHSINEKKQVFYFPSYELMMDELRDYRFYKGDMIHPNDTAVQYIWERFQKTWISEATIPTMKKVEEIQKGLRHKAFHPEGNAHQTFLDTLEAKKKKIQEEFSFMEFD